MADAPRHARGRPSPSTAPAGAPTRPGPRRPRWQARRSG